MTQKEFAGVLDLPLNTYTNYIRGVRSPTIEAVKSICTRTNVSSDWLLGLSDDRTGHLRAVADEHAPYGPSPPVCAGCVSKDATIAQLSASVASLSESLRQLSGGVPEKKTSRPARCAVTV